MACYIKLANNDDGKMEYEPFIIITLFIIIFLKWQLCCRISATNDNHNVSFLLQRFLVLCNIGHKWWLCNNICYVPRSQREERRVWNIQCIQWWSLQSCWGWYPPTPRATRVSPQCETYIKCWQGCRIIIELIYAVWDTIKSINLNLLVW